ncbi:MAG: MYG1 family protein [Parachlamydiales bacterium]|jgi:uncharacterized UPF0160 family protein
MENEIINRSFGTHDGSFHADEVTACALLLLYNLIDKDKIYRTRDMDLLNRCQYVCDVGGIYDPKIKRFDHHQKEYTGELSSAGMVLNYLKNQGMMEVSLYEHLNNTLVRYIDAHDIGKSEGKNYSFSHVIANFLPIDYNASIKEKNESFFQAVDFTYLHLKRMEERFYYSRKCMDRVKKAMESKDKYLIFDESIPWIESFFELGGESHPALFVVMPSQSHWKLRGIPPDSANRMKVRLPLPFEWAGLHADDLKKVSNIEGAIFCHKGRFISIWKTKEDAMKALKYVLKKAGVEHGNNI